MDKAVRRRDLASPDLWDRSLRRSRERRRVAEIHRRTAPRRKGVSLAVSAALLASPVVPRFASAHAGSGAGATTEDTGGGPAAAQAPRLLERGDTGAAVEKVQRAIGVTADGIFGPITEAAVKRFQGHEGLSRTGKVDPSTWMKLFSGNVTVLEAGTPEAQAIQTAAGDEPTPPIAASTSPAKDDSGAPVATPAAFQPAEEERGSSDTGAEPREPREPARTRRASSDDRDRAPSKRWDSSGRESSRESSGEDRERGTNRPVSDEREESRPSPAPAPSGGGGGGGGSCDGDFARPVNGTVTGTFGEDRGGRSHEGMDIAAPSGTPIKAATCGRVSEAGSQGGYGNIICIRASESFTTCYAHMSRFGASVGQYVKIGEVIGYVGCTGSCTGPHVHFEVRIDGQKVDPAPYLNGSKRGPSARSSSTMAVSLTDSTRKTPEAKAAKREKVERQHDEAAQDPAQQPQISRPAAGGEVGATAPTGETSPTTASTDDTAASAPAAADPSTQVPGEEADPASGVVQDTTGAVEETAAAVEDTTGSVEETGTDTGAVEETTSSATEEATGAVEEVTDAPGSDTSSVEETTGTVDETTSSIDEDASSAAGETTETDAPGSDTDTGAAEESPDGTEEDTSGAVDETTSAVEETTGSVEEDASSAVDEPTSAVDETTGSSDEATDAPGQDGPESSNEDASGGDSSGSDASGDGDSGAGESAGATAGG